jgi:hypothetical protein
VTLPAHWARAARQDIGLRTLAGLGLVLYLVFIVLRCS